MAALSASTWGDPSASKHVLLIHGLTSSSHFWYRIARGFASRGYFVTAPDLLGHGIARRSSDYTVAALAEELHPLFNTASGSEHPYHIVVGHSLGCHVASSLFPLLKSTRSVQVILVDPPLELAPEVVPFHRQMFSNELKNPKTPETHLEENPLWTREDAIFRTLSIHLCDLTAMESIFDQNSPWSFSHRLSTVPDNIKVTVLAADPSKMALVREEELKPYPHVAVKTIWGTSHVLPLEDPDVVVETALEGAEK